MGFKLISKICTTFLAIVIGIETANGAISLEKYNIDGSAITVSGISSGAIMASQFHFAHSSEVSGAGIVAGVPYCCGIGGLSAATICMTTPSIVNMNLLISEANSLAATGYIDSTSGISGDKVFIFHGSKDSTVHLPSGQNVHDMYIHYGANIKTEFGIPAEHGFPTDGTGAACGSNSANSDYLNDCGYHGAFEILNHLYGNTLNRPSGSEGILGNLYEFDQTEYFSFDPSLSSMDRVGYIYVPNSCKSGARCKLHISFHGCMQSRGNVGNSYAANAGFMEVAELNDVIVLFPQIAATGINLTSCWDWFGYLNNYFSTKDGNQILATYRMMNRLVYG